MQQFPYLAAASTGVTAVTDSVEVSAAKVKSTEKEVENLKQNLEAIVKDAKKEAVTLNTTTTEVKKEAAPATK